MKALVWPVEVCGPEPVLVVTDTDVAACCVIQLFCSDAEKTAGIPIDVVQKGAKRGKEGVRQALQLAQHSTASMGRYDDKRYGEPEKKIQGKKRKFSDNVGSATLAGEKKLMKSQLRIVADKTDKKARGVTNSLAAYEGILPDAPSDSFRAKKGKQSGVDTGKSKKTATGQKKRK